MRSAPGPGSAGFLYAIPSEPALTLNNMQMEGAVRLRLGLSPITTRVDPSLRCVCGGSVEVDHLLTCKRGVEVCNRHNNMVQAWTSLLKKSSVRSTFSIERSLISLGVLSVEDCSKCMDIVESSSSSKTTFADVTISHSTPCTLSNLRRFASSNGSAAAAAETRKVRIYGDAAREVNAVFIPLAVETYGRWGNQALQFSRERIKHFANNMQFDGQVDRGLINKLQCFWWSSLSCCLQKGNMAIIQSRYYKALEHKYGDQLRMRKFSIKRVLNQ